MRIGKRNRFTGKRVDVIRGEGSPVGKDFNQMAAEKNTFRALPTDPVFSRASEKPINKYNQNDVFTAKNPKPLIPTPTSHFQPHFFQ
ncbi:hypothetical protein NTJ56_33055 [Burkholderia contaminans]|uniref:hypothetical protein n=1 Tax=Burkholderia contaminans TaxID=488447 RepID=UPI001CF4DCEE|nr:hypothetical protein [Burkholderia contaminans]MCA7917308.1 hypothetical protein [Burkholderia contaminans]MCA8100618.1 hypothetical protein [Burkholderia contaminans]UUX42471.1 hypothetical protein NTJ56_33055 [Burkholderia contaminans]